MAAAAGPALILAGFGSSSPLQLTIETQQLAVHAGHVLTLALPERLKTLLHRQGVSITPLDELLAAKPYAEGYAAVARAVLAQAETDPPAMFLSQGSPMFANAITRFLATEARRLELPVRILPGVAPVDVVVAELGVDIARSGLQTLTAAGFVARPKIGSPRMPMLLLEVAGAGDTASTGSGYDGLVEALGSVYPDAQPVTLVRMNGSGGVARLTTELAKFADLIPKIDNSSCLFIDVRRKSQAPANLAQEPR